MGSEFRERIIADGIRTFADAGFDAGALLAENQAKFASKWGFQESAGRPVAIRSETSA